MPNIGITGIVLLVVLALLLFGPSKLPQLGRAIGTTFNEFRKGAKGLMDAEDDGGQQKESASKKNTDA
ncbi:twin-arginine translocase TatA/TatE family subunit [Paenibacillus sp. NEAU-GSW1]|uniref:twin-arginine translocase TatA/TatE family subunit n=1 Tax=Paenibacillus sp. NEAU-GSW1 TaxID=2682486 RepID=UPI0012E3066F|nr:twin-arginine translocase TatA/TatE family subunit [Paenibacillus sp. NEAU-GSW1]MUT68688.1 twin-arginine translocase TatA/TatE family subunit [Paenibacillus sp. NEAU-GSW1]